MHSLSEEVFWDLLVRSKLRTPLDCSMIKISAKVVCIISRYRFAYKVGTMYYQTLFSANSAWAAEEVKGWLVPETGPLLTIFCGSPSLVPDTHQHGSPLSISSARTVLTRSSLPLSTSQKIQYSPWAKVPSYSANAGDWGKPWGGGNG